MKISSYVLSALLITGCASAADSAPDKTASAAEASVETSQPAATGTDVAAAIAEADAAREKAASIGHEWRDTAEILEKAREALAEGDAATAGKLAAKAELQGEAAYRQGIAQKDTYHIPL